MITPFAVKTAFAIVVSFVVTLRLGGSVAVEDEEEREAEKPEGWF